MLPSRLLQVGTDISAEVRLVENLSVSGQYMTLSYCWGSSRPLTTTRGTLQQRKTKIALEDLPKTFRDAVHITRRLGIPYLWIDSLCIIQDELQDWEVESSKMAGIYSGSYLNLAAMSSVDSRGGCVPEREPRYIEIKRNGSRPYSVFAAENVARNSHQLIERTYYVQLSPLVSAPPPFPCPKTEITPAVPSMGLSGTPSDPADRLFHKRGNVLGMHFLHQLRMWLL